MLSTKEVSAYVGKSPAHIRMLLSRHPELAPKKVGRAWVWTEEEVERLKRFIKGSNEITDGSVSV